MPSITSFLCEPVYSGVGAGFEEAGGSVSVSGTGSVADVSGTVV